jgi:hypothetical protein
MIFRKNCITLLAFVGFFTCLAFNRLSAQSSGGGSQNRCYTYLTARCPTPTPPRNCSDNACRQVLVTNSTSPPTFTTKYLCDKAQEIYSTDGSWQVAAEALPGEPRIGNNYGPSPTTAVYCLEVQACNKDQYCNGPNFVCSTTSTSSYGSPNYSIVIYGTCP